MVSLSYKIESNMSLSVSRNNGELEWAGKNLDTIFAQRKNLFSSELYLMIYDIMRFNKQCNSLSLETDINPVETHWSSKLTIGEFLTKFKYSKPFYDNYLVPMTAAIVPLVLISGLVLQTLHSKNFQY